MNQRTSYDYHKKLIMESVVNMNPISITQLSMMLVDSMKKMEID